VNLLTADVGGGKTNYIVSLLKKKNNPDVPVYFVNVPLNLDECPENWHVITPQELENWKYLGIDKPIEQITDNDHFERIVVIDEAHKVWDSEKYKGSREDWEKDLTEYRHYGFNFYLITQKPLLIWAFVRKLVFEHTHIFYPAGLFRYKKIFQEYVENPKKSKAEGLVVPHFLDKKAFKLYDSSKTEGGAKRSAHPVMKGLVYFLVPFLLIMFFSFVVRVYYMVTSFAGGFGSESESVVTSSIPSPRPSVLPYSFLNFTPAFIRGLHPEHSYSPFGSPYAVSEPVVLFSDPSHTTALTVSDIEAFGYSCRFLDSGVQCKHLRDSQSFFAPFHAVSNFGVSKSQPMSFGFKGG
jgi:hypothetical protein